jgi:hypothetical protein
LSGASLLLATSLAGAADPANYDCWIGNFNGTYTTQFIRCIVDRSADAPIENVDNIV